MANLTAFLASGHASSITGKEHVIDGEQCRRSKVGCRKISECRFRASRGLLRVRKWPDWQRTGRPALGQAKLDL
ncbi:hypothetical protein [Paracoccus aminophilus]|uniref:hypothetical protein n=1 Tax=Paracoccus aminophilus TaxID=34003 RepID=UPI001F2D9858|nr:hypothetical protein [Paracoccus aminophilus]